MPFHIADHGDPIERRYAALLQQGLPGYVRIWDSYFGNDGQSRLPDMVGLAKEDEERRRATNQFSYSAVLSYLSAVHIGRRLSGVHMDAEDERARGGLYLHIATDIVSFFAHIGRVRDMMEKIAVVWRDPDIAGPLNDYYQQRNNVLHEGEVPRSFIEGVLVIIPPEGEQPNAASWRRGSTWWTADLNVAVFAEDYVRETLLGLKNHLNDAFERLYALHIAPALQRTGARFITLPPVRGPRLASGEPQKGPL